MCGVTRGALHHQTITSGDSAGRGEDPLPYISQLFHRDATPTIQPAPDSQAVTVEILLTHSSGDARGIQLLLRSFEPHRKSEASAEEEGGWTVSCLSVTVSSIPAQPPTALL